MRIDYVTWKKKFNFKDFNYSVCYLKTTRAQLVVGRNFMKGKRETLDVSLERTPADYENLVSGLASVKLN